MIGIQRRWQIWLLATPLGLALWASEASPQQAPSQLTLEDAISLARGSSPTFLRTQNDQAAADWQVREA
jgi:hypothetical protein